MGKISKSDLPIDRRGWREIQKDYFKHKTQHFAIGTRVVCNNLGGLIIRKSKDGGTKLLVEWDDGTITPIPNPNYRGNLKA